MNIIWDEEKSAKLKKERGISLDEVAEMILRKHYVDIVKHPKRAGQKSEIPQKARREGGMKAKLDKYEREIEKSADSYQSIPKGERVKIENLLDKVRKSRNVNIRISESVLEQLKRRSQEEGIPYQTLISSILHKFVTDRLVDEKSIRRSLQILSSSR